MKPTEIRKEVIKAQTKDKTAIDRKKLESLGYKVRNHKGDRLIIEHDGYRVDYYPAHGDFKISGVGLDSLIDMLTPKSEEEQ